jgi:hypothetical protein
MEESYGEGLATHTGPESCAEVREGLGEALTGAYVGRVSSRENVCHFRGADAVGTAEGNIVRVVKARRSRALRGRRPRHACETPCTGTGRSRGRPYAEGIGDAAGKPEA